jgi:nucleoside-triphosphatase THEP1
MNNINSNIYLLTRPIRSGKTTQLQEWLKTHNDTTGILTPDIGGKRMIYDITRNKFHSFEVDQSYGADVIMIGKFLFAKTAFALAKEIIEQAITRNCDWTIIDEVGKLEIEQGEGFEPSILRLVKAFQAGKEGKLLLVIRDSLLMKAMEKYELLGCKIMSAELP